GAGAAGPQGRRRAGGGAPRRRRVAGAARLPGPLPARLPAGGGELHADRGDARGAGAGRVPRRGVVRARRGRDGGGAGAPHSPMAARPGGRLGAARGGLHQPGADPGGAGGPGQARPAVRRDSPPTTVSSRTPRSVSAVGTRPVPTRAKASPLGGAVTTGPRLAAAITMGVTCSARSGNACVSQASPVPKIGAMQRPTSAYM